MPSEVRIVPTGCTHNCGGRCVLEAHVQNGVVVRITSEQFIPPAPGKPSLRACARGRAYRQRLYAPDRLREPLKRVGDRGEGRFMPITWDEALDHVSRELLRIKSTYGPTSILNISSSGNATVLHNPRSLIRLLNMFGGHTQAWGNLSRQAEGAAGLVTYGSLDPTGLGQERSDFPNAKLLVMWGWNPVDTVYGTGTARWIMEAKAKGTRLICIDPRYTESAALAHEYIPIRPSTDAALMLSMAFVMIDENLHDQAFLDRYTVGFDDSNLPPNVPSGQSFRTYVTGQSDGLAKTPNWASEITGVPAETIVRLAREFASTKPVALHTGFGPGRTAQGESFHRLAVVLSAMTGNIGVTGSNMGLTTSVSHVFAGGLPIGVNPTRSRVSNVQWAEAILQGREGGFPSDIKMVYSTFGNLLNQVGDVNRSVKALRQVESVIVHEQFLTPLARFADIVLPTTTWFEREDMALPWGNAGHYAIFLNKVVEPMYQCRSDLDICTELAARLDLSDYNPKTDDQWLRQFVASAGIDDYEGFKSKGVHWFPEPEIGFSFQKEIADPQKHPFRTPTGKIEIMSTLLVEKPNYFGLGALPPIPTFADNWEGPGHPLARQYPLQFISPHTKRRTHSTLDNIPWLRDLEPQAVWINPDDATARGIDEGNSVRIFNDRGEMRLPAKVTPRIMPGVVAVNQGAWFQPEQSGIDIGGSANILCTGEPTPGGGAINHTALVQIELVGKEVR